MKTIAGAHYNILEKPQMEILAAQLRKSLTKARERGSAGNNNG